MTRCGLFVPPPDPTEAEQALKDELAQLRKVVADYKVEVVHLETTAKEQARLEARARAEAKTAYDELAVALELAGETEAKAARLVRRGRVAAPSDGSEV